MNLDLRPFYVLWAILAATVLALLAWRKSVASHEDDSIHVLGGDLGSQQVAIAHKLETIDKWGKLMTVITVAMGLLLAAVFLYQSWVQGSSTTQFGA